MGFLSALLSVPQSLLRKWKAFQVCVRFLVWKPLMVLHFAAVGRYTAQKFWIAMQIVLKKTQAINCVSIFGYIIAMDHTALQRSVFLSGCWPKYYPNPIFLSGCWSKYYPNPIFLSGCWSKYYPNPLFLSGCWSKYYPNPIFLSGCWSKYYPNPIFFLAILKICISID